MTGNHKSGELLAPLFLSLDYWILLGRRQMFLMKPLISARGGEASRGREIFEEKTFRSGLHQKSTVVNYSEMVANVFLILNIYK